MYGCDTSAFLVIFLLFFEIDVIITLRNVVIFLSNIVSGLLIWL